MSPQDCHAVSFCTQRSRTAAAIRTYHARHTLRTAAVKRSCDGRRTSFCSPLNHPYNILKQERRNTYQYILQPIPP